MQEELYANHLKEKDRMNNILSMFLDKAYTVIERKANLRGHGEKARIDMRLNRAIKFYTQSAADRQPL